MTSIRRDAEQLRGEAQAERQAGPARAGGVFWDAVAGAPVPDLGEWDALSLSLLDRVRQLDGVPITDRVEERIAEALAAGEPPPEPSPDIITEEI